LPVIGEWHRKHLSPRSKLQRAKKAGAATQDA
jgi:hypothetical protein